MLKFKYSNIYTKIMVKELDKIDKRILYELDLNSRISEAQIGKKVRKSRETVHYRIKQLMEKGIIKGYRAWVNLSKLGYHGFKLYLKISGDETEQKEFFDHIKSRKDIFWLGIADGAWDVGLTFFEKSSEEFFKKKNELFAKFSEIIVDRQTGILANVYIYPKKFLWEESKEPRLMFGEYVPNEIDKIERKILGIFLQDARIKLVELATKVGSTVEVVRNRIKRLEEKGIITGYTLGIDYEKLGLEFYKTFLYFDKLDDKNEKKLLEFCKQHPNILHIVRQVSPWDVELEIMVENYSKYNGIIRKLRKLFPHELRNVESAVMSEDHVFPAKESIFG